MRYPAPAFRLVLISVTIYCAPCVMAAAPENLLRNGSAEQTGEGNAPAAWFTARIPAPELTMERTAETSHSGKHSLFIANDHEYDQRVSNNWAQKLEHVPKEKTIRLEAWLRTQDAEAANICVQCWSGKPKRMLAFASTPVTRGTQKWTGVRSRAIVVPLETEEIMVRTALTGRGKAWFDDLTLTIVEGEASGEEQTDLSSDDQKRLAELARGEILDTLPVDKDCMVLSYLPDWQHGNVDNIGVANNNGGVRTLLAWNSEKLPANALSGDKRLLLALYSRQTTARPDPGSIRVCRLTEPWPEITSWKTQPSFAEPPVAEHDFLPGEGWKLFDVTPLVRSQIESEEHHGIILRFLQEDRKSKTWSGYAFVSREGLGEWAGKRPRLLIVESPKNGGE